MIGPLKLLFHPLPVRLDPAPLRSAAEPASWSLPGRADSRVLLTFHGTAAVYQAVRSLRLAEGEKVLIPSYNCGHELEPVLRAGAGVGFYGVDARLDVELDDLAAAIDPSTRAVLVTHYFGFPQRIEPIRRLCDRHNLSLIEDCAHALFSCDGDTPIGVAGDFAVYSLRKSLPLPHGGALVCHDPRRPLPAVLPRPPRFSTALKWLDRYRKSFPPPRQRLLRPLTIAALLGARLAVDMGRGVGALGRRLGAVQWDPDDESLGFPGAVLEWGAAASVEQALHRARPQAIVAARRRNFARLLSAGVRFTDCVPLIGELPPGVCPLYFPVLAENPLALVRRLQRHAVSAAPWWDQFHPAVPWRQFPEARRLKARIVVLPIHQDLQDAHMDRIIGLLERG
jgi:dTDP-4-amino-4,6-dideoxygalactose transaminase